MDFNTTIQTPRNAQCIPTWVKANKTFLRSSTSVAFHHYQDANDKGLWSQEYEMEIKYPAIVPHRTVKARFGQESHRFTRTTFALMDKMAFASIFLSVSHQLSRRRASNVWYYFLLCLCGDKDVYGKKRDANLTSLFYERTANLAVPFNAEEI